MALTYNPAHGILDFSGINNALGRYTQGVNQAELMQRKLAQDDLQKQQYNALLSNPQMDLDPAYRNALSGMAPADGRKALVSRMAEREKASTPPWWAGPNGQVDPAYIASKRAGANQTTVNMPTQEKAFDKETGTQLAKDFVKAQQSIATSSRTLGMLKVMERTLDDPNLYTGTGGETVQGLKKMAGTLFGINVQGVSSGEVAANLAKEIALGMKDKLPGPMSNSDRDFLVDISPGLRNSPEGNRQIIKIGMLSKQYEIDRARAQIEYAKRNRGRTDVGVYDAINEVDARYGELFGKLIGELRGMRPEQNRSPATGTGLQDPFGSLRQMYKGLE